MKVFAGLLLGIFCAIAVAGTMVAYNTQSGKYHKTSCKWALRCTENCIEISIEDAVNRGGVPCKVCKPRR